MCEVGVDELLGSTSRFYSFVTGTDCQLGCCSPWLDCFCTTLTSVLHVLQRNAATYCVPNVSHVTFSQSTVSLAYIFFPQCLLQWSVVQLSHPCAGGPQRSVACPLCKAPYENIIHDCGAGGYYRWEYLRTLICVAAIACISHQRVVYPPS